MTKTLESILSCNMLKIPKSVFDHYFMQNLVWYAKNQKMKDFFQCKVNKGVTDCLPVLEEACTSSTIRATKVIRYRMDLVEDLLNQTASSNVNMKVIHLIRDPRGILMSRKYKTLLDDTLEGRCVDRDVNITMEKLKLANLLCQQIVLNIKEEHKLREKFPGKIMQIRYEYIATDTQNAVKDIYDFVGESVKSQLQERMDNKTHAARDGPMTGTTRRNGTWTAMRWKAKEEDFHEAMAKEPYCHQLFTYFAEHYPEYL